MRLFVFTFVSALLCATPSLRAEDLPSRKPGLWQLKTTIDRPDMPSPLVQTCVDAATDATMFSMFSLNPYSQACPKQAVQRSADAITIDWACTVAGKPLRAHAVVTGNFESAYTMTVTSEGDPGDTIAMRTEAKWLGPCTSDQRPGDIILGGGLKINIIEGQKDAPSPAFPQR